MACLDSMELYSALYSACENNPMRHEALLEDSTLPLTEVEDAFYLKVHIVRVARASKPVYFEISGINLPAIKGTTEGREVWGNEAETKSSKFKISIRLSDDVTCSALQLIEALIKRKVGDIFPSDNEATKVSISSESSVSAQWGIGCEITLASSYKAIISRKLILDDCPEGKNFIIPDDMLLDEEHGVPMCDKRSRDGVRTFYEVVSAIKPEIISTSNCKVKWGVKQMLVCQSVQKAGQGFRVPLSIFDVTEGGTWALDTNQKKGKNLNTYHNLRYSNNADDNSFAVPFWLQQSDATSTNVQPLRVVQNWPSMEASKHDVTLVVTGSVLGMQKTQIICNNIDDLVEKSVKDLFPKYKANKKLSWRDSLTFITPLKQQKHEEIEKYGKRPEDWYKIRINDPAAGQTYTPVYELVDDVENISKDDEVFSKDPIKLVKEGRLKGPITIEAVGKGSEIYIAVAVSKINTSPKFSYAFRALYVIASKVNVPEQAMHMMTEDGQSMQHEVTNVAAYMEMLQNDKKRKLNEI